MNILKFLLHPLACYRCKSNSVMCWQ